MTNSCTLYLNQNKLERIVYCSETHPHSRNMTYRRGLWMKQAYEFGGNALMPQDPVVRAQATKPSYGGGGLFNDPVWCLYSASLFGHSWLKGCVLKRSTRDISCHALCSRYFILYISCFWILFLQCLTSDFSCLCLRGRVLSESLDCSNLAAANLDEACSKQREYNCWFLLYEKSAYEGGHFY